MNIFLWYVPGRHVAVFTRSSSVARALASTPICCSTLQYTKMIKPSAGTWFMDPWVRVMPSFLCASLFQNVNVRVGDDVSLVATWNLFVIFTRYGMPLLSGSSPVDLACLRNHLLHACRYWYCGCRPQDTAVRRDRTHYSFSSIRAVVYCFSSNMRNKLVGLRRILLVCLFVFFMRLVPQVFFTRTRMIRTYSSYVVWRETRMRCGLLYHFRYWGACWSNVLVLIWYHMYVREDCSFWFYIKIFHFFSRYLILGSPYVFFFRFK